MAYIAMALTKPLALLPLMVLLVLCWNVVHSKDTDQFNYRFKGTTVLNTGTGAGSSIVSFGLEDWGKITCSGRNLTTCAAYPDSWGAARNWSLPLVSACRWCPAGGTNSAECKLGRQSPIRLRREAAIPQSAFFNQCFDHHWMQYQDGSCTWDDYKNQFTIERHALRIHIPITSQGEIGCNRQGRRIFPRIDYSYGFPEWWFLMHTEIKCPSEHFQGNKQYKCEVVLSHFYSVADGNKAGQVAIFLDSYSSKDCWPFIDKLICQWREVEEKVRRDCGLPPAPPYPGCRLFRGQAPPPSNQTPPETTPVDCEPYQNVNGGINVTRMCTDCCGYLWSETNFCQVVYKALGANLTNGCYNCCGKLAGTPPPVNPSIPPIDCTTVGDDPSKMCSSCCTSPRSNSTYCVGAYNKWGNKTSSLCWYCCRSPKLVGPSIRSSRHSPKRVQNTTKAPGADKMIVWTDMYGRTIKLRPENFRPPEKNEKAYFNDMYKAFQLRSLASERRVFSLNYDDVYYWPYEWMLAVQTEYYFRYKGTLTVPPCYDQVNWRVMKDPIRVCERQIKELERLIAWRIAPKGSPFNCTKDTAGRVRPQTNGTLVDVNRPMQNLTVRHDMVFCECANWPSKFTADQNWCKIKRITDRFFRRPYNFVTNGTF